MSQNPEPGLTLKVYREFKNTTLEILKDLNVQKTILDVIGEHESIWKDFLNNGEDWEQIGMKVWERTQKIVSVPQLRLFWKLSAKNIALFLRECICEYRLDEEATERQLAVASLYPHIRFYREELVEYEKQLRNEIEGRLVETSVLRKIEEQSINLKDYDLADVNYDDLAEIAVFKFSVLLDDEIREIELPNLEEGREIRVFNETIRSIPGKSNEMNGHESRYQKQGKRIHSLTIPQSTNALQPPNLDHVSSSNLESFAAFPKFYGYRAEFQTNAGDKSAEIEEKFRDRTMELYKFEVEKLKAKLDTQEEKAQLGNASLNNPRDVHAPVAKNRSHRETSRTRNSGTQKYVAFGFLNYDRPFHIFCDASAVAQGAALMQERIDNPKQYFTIAYASRKLYDPETRWPAIQVEMGAIIYALRQFKPYICISKIILHSDHKPLTFLLQKSKTHDNLARWLIELQCYDIAIVHISGK